MLISYVEIENYKIFGDKIRIDFNDTSVIIGPNNSGKTSAIQALALWSRGVREWYDKKGQPRSKKTQLERFSAGINRLNILEVPVAESRFFWKDTQVHKRNTSVELSITAGVVFKGTVHDVKMIFTYRDSETIYCKPSPETRKDDQLIEAAANIQISLLYPMSGIMAGISAETEETQLPDGRINVYLGQGQTAQVLRNICFNIAEADKQEGTDDWGEIVKIINKLFVIELGRPVFNVARGSLMLGYRQKGIDLDLDISLAGRGQQQVLLILAYLYWHKNSILLIDEPDAHLEILRQRQIFDIIKYIAVENGSQVIIATHSEVILEDAVDTNLTLLIDGKSIDLASKGNIISSLRHYEIENYFISPELLIKYIDSISLGDSLFTETYHERAKGIIKDQLLAIKFAGNEELYSEYERSSQSLRRTILGDMKMSEFAEMVFNDFKNEFGPLAFKKKSEYFTIIKLLDVADIQPEVVEKLDMLLEYLR